MGQSVWQHWWVGMDDNAVVIVFRRSFSPQPERERERERERAEMRSKISPPPEEKNMAHKSDERGRSRRQPYRPIRALLLLLLLLHRCGPSTSSMKASFFLARATLEEVKGTSSSCRWRWWWWCHQSHPCKHHFSPRTSAPGYRTLSFTALCVCSAAGQVSQRWRLLL